MHGNNICPTPETEHLFPENTCCVDYLRNIVWPKDSKGRPLTQEEKDKLYPVITAKIQEDNSNGS